LLKSINSVNSYKRLTQKDQQILDNFKRIVKETNSRDLLEHYTFVWKEALIHLYQKVVHGYPKETDRSLKYYLTQMEKHLAMRIFLYMNKKQSGLYNYSFLIKKIMPDWSEKKIERFYYYLLDNPELLSRERNAGFHAFLSNLTI
jgi:hypothetical protein